MSITITVDAAELPEAVQRGAQTMIDDPVDVFTGWSGLSQRNRKNTHRPRQLVLGYGVRDKADRQKIIDLSMTNGNLVGFLCRDPIDYQIANQNIGTGDGSNRSFFLKKTYTNDAGRTYDRWITRPVESSVTVTVAAAPSLLFTVGSLGEILFNVGHAPANGAAVVVTAANFLLPVVKVGKLTVRADTLLKISVPTITVEELFERPNA